MLNTYVVRTKLENVHGGYIVNRGTQSGVQKQCIWLLLKI